MMWAFTDSIENLDWIHTLYHSAGKRDRDPNPPPVACSKVAVGGRELWVPWAREASERVKFYQFCENVAIILYVTYLAPTQGRGSIAAILWTAVLHDIRHSSEPIPS